MTVDDITVDLRLNSKTDSKCKAFADVTLLLGGDGVFKILGYSVFEKEGRSSWVAPPARKGTHAFFPVVQLIGKVESLVSEAVLVAYRRAIQSAE
jgi:hypothetical protein